MSIEVKKQERELTQSLVRRFTRAVRESGILYNVRRRRFYARPKSSLARRLAALRKEELKKEQEWREKMGRN